MGIQFYLLKFWVIKVKGDKIRGEKVGSTQREANYLPKKQKNEIGGKKNKITIL